MPEHSDVEYSNLVVAHYKDGRLFKGKTFDFSPDRPTFFVQPAVDLPGSQPQLVNVNELKAVFFVRKLEGFPDRKDVMPNSMQPGPGERVVIVKFTDGEIILGATLTYAQDRPGFFIKPANRDSNNVRIFIMKQYLDELRVVRPDENLPRIIEEMQAS